MKQLGDWLRQARMEKGLSLEQVEELTKIRVKYLKALEDGDLDSLPGRVYTIGFLRTYAQVVDLHADNVIAYFKEHVPEQEQVTVPVDQTIVYKSRKRTQRNNLIAFLLLGVLVIILLIAGIYWFTHRGTGEPGEGLIDPNPVVTEPYSGMGIGDYYYALYRDLEPKPEPPPVVEEPPPPTTVKVTVTAYAGSCWIGVQIDGGYVDYTLGNGESRTFESREPIVIKYGNAGAVAVDCNGEIEKPLGTDGQVLTRTYALNTEDND